MNFELPDWMNFNLTFGINCFNFLLGFITLADIQVLSGLVGLVINLIFFLVKMYWLIRNNVNPAAAENKTHDIDDSALFERRCLNCNTDFVPQNSNQIFCTTACFESKLDDLQRPRLNAKDEAIEIKGPLSIKL